MKAFEKKIWLSSPTMHGEEQKYIQDAFVANWISTIGENINELEKTVCEYVGCDYAVALCAGTAAIHMALKLTGVKQGDKVFCSDLTFAATANPITYEKCQPVFIDSEYETWNMDPKALERAFEKYPDVKVVIAVHLYGVPAKIDEIKAICDKHGAILIEDAAESLGATYKGQQTGTFGTYNAISFNGNKIITCSSGGMLLTNDEKAAELVKKWSTQSREKAPWYQHEDTGYNYRFSNVLAGIGRGQMLHLDEHIAKKTQIYQRYQEGLKHLPLQMNPYMEHTTPNFWLSCLLINKEAMCLQNRMDCTYTYTDEEGKSCPEAIRECLDIHNAESRPIWKPLHMQPIFAGCDFITAVDGVCVDEDIFERGLCLPSDIKMTEEEQDAIIEMICSCF